MSRIGIALASGSDAASTTADATQRAAKDLGCAPELALVFSTDGYPADAVLSTLRDLLGDVPVAGCQAPGVLCGDAVTHDGIGVLVAGGGQLTMHSAAAEGANVDSAAAGARSAEAALDALDESHQSPEFETSVLLAFPDAIAGNPCAALRGLNSSVGGTVRVVGGGAGDNLRFESTYQYADRAHTGAVVSAALSASRPIGTALRHGCSAWGPPMKVTRCDGKLLQELEWEPAYEHYVRVVEQVSGEVVAADTFQSYALLHPLGLPQEDGNFVLRSPFSPGASGEIHCCSDIPSDGVARIMVGDEDSLLTAAHDAGAAAVAAVDGAPAAALVFACVSRDLVLGGAAQDVSRELAAVRRAVGRETPVFGCLTFGQIGTLGGGLPQFHSKSIQVVALPSAA